MNPINLQHPINWSPGVTLQSIVRQTIQRAMQFYHGNKSAVANALGITVKTLDSKLEIYAQEDKHQLEFQEYEARKKQYLLLRARGIDPGETERAFFEGQTGHSISKGLEKKPAVGPTENDELSLSKQKAVSKVLPVQTSESSIRKRGRPAKTANG